MGNKLIPTIVLFVIAVALGFLCTHVADRGDVSDKDYGTQR